jgi:hypothetical protein
MNYYRSVSSKTGVKSGVKGYDVGDDYIKIYFSSGSWYLYTYSSCGQKHLEAMKLKARMQSGLNTYANQHKPKFQDKS